jgi:hypothetical protein
MVFASRAVAMFAILLATDAIAADVPGARLLQGTLSIADAVGHAVWRRRGGSFIALYGS